MISASTMTCFEKRFGAMSDDSGHVKQLIDTFYSIFSLSRELKFSLPFYKWTSTKRWRKLVAAEDHFFSHGQSLVDETLQRIKTASDTDTLKENDFYFLSYLMGRSELSYKDVSIITLSLFSDGLSTTTPTLLCNLFCLAKNPEIQDKLYDEITKIIKDPSETVTAVHTSNMPYLKACIKETFRLFPIGPEVNRLPQKNLIIGGYQIPAGTYLELNNYVLLRDPNYFSDPLAYQPERWLRGGTAQTVHPYLLTPFSHGPRMCAGRRFAEQELHVLLIKFLLNFKLRWTSEKDMEQAYNMLLFPSDTTHFAFDERQNRTV